MDVAAPQFGNEYTPEEATRILLHFKREKVQIKPILKEWSANQQIPIAMSITSTRSLNSIPGTRLGTRWRLLNFPSFDDPLTTTCKAALRARTLLCLNFKQPATRDRWRQIAVHQYTAHRLSKATVDMFMRCKLSELKLSELKSFCYVRTLASVLDKKKLPAAKGTVQMVQELVACLFELVYDLLIVVSTNPRDSVLWRREPGNWPTRLCMNL